jgi:hypothetical protein
MKSSSRSLGESLAGFGTDSFRLVNSQAAFQRAAFIDWSSHRSRSRDLFERAADFLRLNLLTKKSKTI